MISEFIDRVATDADLIELEDETTGETKRYRIRSLSNVVQEGTPLNKATLDPLLSEINNKVAKETGKGLSTNDFSDAYKDKVDNAMTSDAITSGSGAAGSWVRFPDGTQICWRQMSFKLSITQAWGSLFSSTSPHPTVPYPQRFEGKPVTWKIPKSGFFVDDVPEDRGGHETNLEWGEWYAVRPMSTPDYSAEILLVALGKWK